MRALLIDTPAKLKTVASTTVKQRWFSELGLSSTCLVFRQDFKLSVLFFWPHTNARSSLKLKYMYCQKTLKHIKPFNSVF